MAANLNSSIKISLCLCPFQQRIHKEKEVNFNFYTRFEMMNKRFFKEDSIEYDIISYFLHIDVTRYHFRFECKNVGRGMNHKVIVRYWSVPHLEYFCRNSRICTRWKCNCCCSILLNAYGVISWKRECSFLIRASDEYFRWDFNHTGVRARQDNVSCFSRFAVSRDAIPFFFLSFFLLKTTSIEIFSRNNITLNPFPPCENSFRKVHCFWLNFFEMCRRIICSLRNWFD